MSKSQGYENTRTSETVLQRITALRQPRLLRGLELSLTLFALVIGVGAVIIVDLTVLGEVSTTLLPGWLRRIVSSSVVPDLGKPIMNAGVARPGSVEDRFQFGSASPLHDFFRA